MTKLVLSLFDLTGNMVKPWRDAGFDCMAVDLQSEPGAHERDGIVHVGGDVLRWLPPRTDYAMVFAFPPCTDVAVSGARWFQDKGLAGLAGAIELLERARQIAEWSGAPWMIENPVSTFASYWRKPDYTFHPADFTGFELGDNYTKKTCLWAGNGFVMPQPHRALGAGKPDDRIHKAPPGPDRANMRSATPMGFARAVFQANARQSSEAAA